MTIYKKQSLFHRMDLPVVVFASMLVQYLFMLKFEQQDAWYEIIKNKGFLVYAVCAVAYIYMFSKLFGNSHKAVSCTLAVVSAVVYTLHIAAFDTVLIYNDELGFGTALKNNFFENWISYIVPGVVVVACCLFVAIVTLKGLRHKLHCVYMSNVRKKKLLTYQLENINSVCYKTNQTVFSFKLADENGAPVDLSDSQYQDLFQCKDGRTNKEYVVFTNYELNDGYELCAFAALCEDNLKQAKLTPVETQEEFDMLEKFLVKTRHITI